MVAVGGPYYDRDLLFHALGALVLRFLRSAGSSTTCNPRFLHRRGYLRCVSEIVVHFVRTLSNIVSHLYRYSTRARRLDCSASSSRRLCFSSSTWSRMVCSCVCCVFYLHCAATRELSSSWSLRSRPAFDSVEVCLSVKMGDSSNMDFSTSSRGSSSCDKSKTLT